MVDILNTPIEYLKGVGPTRGALLREELGVFTFADLLEYFPFRHVDRSQFYKVKDVREGFPYVQLKGNISDIELHGHKRTTHMTATFSDDSGRLQLIWFNGFKWLKDVFKPNVEYIVFGKPSLYGSRYSISHPEVEPYETDPEQLSASMQPVYYSSEKLRTRALDSKGIAKLVKTLLPIVVDHIGETLPGELIQDVKLLDRKQAITNIHYPASARELQRATARLKFEELFFLQLNLLRLKMVRFEKSQGCLFPSIENLFNKFYKDCLKFELTGAQKRVLKEIRLDTLSGKQMNRLLQGDVGSGKTVVAVFSMLMALDNGFQACLMAPTEILANQHFDSISVMLQPLNVNVGILTGSTKQSSRKELLQSLKTGHLQVIIGTHALIEEGVEFGNLGMVIIDEQHRFGVAQRARLWTKGTIPPHVLVMTATPIPRTLAMTLYGDLDVSVIDELPPGRKPIQTVHRYDNHRLRVFGFMREQIKQGRQVYIVYPLVKESETLDLKDLTDGYESIVREFPLPEYAVSIVHGQMKTANKDYEMQRFVKGETQIMVATTVIEVGIDVPNASVMVIENAERFGLSQLHQLRGRVGRGADQSYCILMSSHKLTADGRKRLETMVATNDGFEIAEVDLKLRGPGDIMGTQQSGILDLKIADIAKDEAMIKFAREIARELLEADPDLSKPSNRPVLRRLKLLYKDKLKWGKIS
jgi:ATP-dependent DNA helicase RecG